MTSAAEAEFERMHAAANESAVDPMEGLSGLNGSLGDVMGGSVKISGRNLLDILNAFTSDVNMPPLDDAQEGGVPQQKDNTQPPGTIQPQANLFKNSAAVRKLGGSSKRFMELGRAPPTGGAFAQFFTPGYDDFGYGAPSPMAVSSLDAATRAAAHDPMAYDKIVLAGKRIPGLAVPPAIASETVGGAGRKSKHPPLKSTQQRTGYQHKPKKPHPVVEKARRDGINALIEDLREVVPDGGWKPSTGAFSKTTSLRNALETITGGRGATGRPDKRTKRAVLMDSIATIEQLKLHVRRLEQEVEIVAKAGDAKRVPSVDGIAPEGCVANGQALQQDSMMKVNVEVRQVEKPAAQSVLGVTTATPLVVKIAYFDRRGFLADQCVALRALGLTIKSAELPKANRNGFVQDTFEVDLEDCDAEESNVNTASLEEQLVELLDEAQSIFYVSTKSQSLGEKRART